MSSADDDKLHRILGEIHERLSAPALNGGFDKLMYKVDKIEETQGKILEKVSVIDNTIYDPDKGLYARIKNVESNSVEDVVALDKAVAEMKIAQEVERRTVADMVQQVSQKNVTIHEMQSKLDDLEKWKSQVSAATRWALVTLVGGGLSMVAKFLYDYVVGHIKFV